MRIIGSTIEFKSNPENFNKEREGLKSCTIRRISLWSEMKEFEAYLDYFKLWVNHDTYVTPEIKIINSITHESFTRTIRDISEFEGLWIISWCNEVKP